MRKRADQPSHEQQEAIEKLTRLKSQGWASVADPAAIGASAIVPTNVTFTSSSTAPATYYTASQLMQQQPKF